MKLRSLTCLAALGLLAALTPLATAQTQADHPRDTQYRVFNLGVPLGGSISADNGINDFGWSAGESNYRRCDCARRLVGPRLAP